MNDINFQQMKPILKDGRGLFFEVSNNELIKHIVVTTFKKGAVRGNQFRKNMDQYFFLTSGKAKVITQSIENEKKQETTMLQGSLLYIPRGIAFVTIAEKDSILLEFSPQAFDPNNPDVNRFKIV